MKSVASRSSCSSSAANRRRVRRVEDVEARDPERAPDHLRARGSTRPSRAGRSCRSVRSRQVLDELSSSSTRCACASARRASRASAPRRCRSRSSGRAPRSGRRARRARRLPAHRRNASTSWSNSSRPLEARARARCPAIVARRALGNLALEPLGDRVHVRAVLLADQDERRHARPRRAAPRGLARAAPPRPSSPDGQLELEGAPLHLADPRAHLRVDVLRRAPRAVDPHAQVHLDRRVEVAALERRLFLRPSRPASPPTTRGRAGPAPRARAPRRARAGRRRPRARRGRRARRRRAPVARSPSSLEQVDAGRAACENGPGSSGERPKPRRS